MFIKHIVATVVFSALYLALIAGAQKEGSCQAIDCKFGARCELSGSQSRCVCPSVCPQYVLEICGSDGRSYGNSCFMIVEACRKQKSIVKVSDGACPAPGSPTTQKPFHIPTRISPGIGVPKFPSTTTTAPDSVCTTDE